MSIGGSEECRSTNTFGLVRGSKSSATSARSPVITVRIASAAPHTCSATSCTFQSLHREGACQSSSPATRSVSCRRVRWARSACVIVGCAARRPMPVPSSIVPSAALPVGVTGARVFLASVGRRPRARVAFGRAHPAQRLGEHRDLRGAEVVGEVLGHTPGVHGPAVLEGLPALVGEHGFGAAPVGRALPPLDQAVALHPVDEPGHAAARQHHPLGQLRHAQVPVGLGELDHHVVVGDREAALGLELLLERGEDRGLGPDEGPPRRQLLLAQRGLGHCLTLPIAGGAGAPGNISCLYNR